MSYMNYYKHYNLLNIEISYPEEISTESFSFSKTIEVIKKFLIKIKEFIQNFLKKLLNGFKTIISFLFKRKNKDNEILNRLTTEDKYTIYKQSLLKYTGLIKLDKKLSLEDIDNLQVYKDTLIGPNGRTKFFINKDGSIIDLDKMEKEYDKQFNDIKNNVGGPIDSKTLKDKLERNETGLIINSSNQLNNVDFNGLFKLFDIDIITDIKSKLDKLPNEVTELEKTKYELEEKLNELVFNSSIIDEESRNIDNELNKLSKMIVVLVAKFKIYQSIIGFYRMVSYELNQFTFDEPCPKDLTLYHLSFDSELVRKNNGVLDPRYPISANFKSTDSAEILPKRTSFSPTVEGCYYGIFDYVMSNELYYPLRTSSRIRERFIEVFLYEGVWGDKVRKIKDEYMRDSVFEYTLSKETAITTPIKVNKLGKIRITFDNSTNAYQRNPNGSSKKGVKKFVGYEFIDG